MRRLLAGVLAASLLAGCTWSGLGTVKIASSSPLTGGQSALGVEMSRGVALAVEAAREEFKSLGVTLEHVVVNDEADPAVGIRLAQELVSDADVLAVVGPLNSDVALAQVPVFEAAQVAVVSPTNTNPALTETEDGQRAFTVYHRLVARDDQQGPAGARFAVNTLGARVIYVLHDRTQYGQGLAEGFAIEARRLGAKVTMVEGINPAAAEFGSVLKRVVRANPDLLYFGGYYDTAARLFPQARSQGYEGIFMGGDGLDHITLVEQGGDAVNHTYFTSVVSDTVFVSEQGRQLAQTYSSRYGVNPSPWVAYAYDATNVVLAALRAHIEENRELPSRGQLVSRISGTRGLPGLTGEITLDQRGDRMGSKIYVHKIEDGQYQTADTEGE